MLDQRRAQEKGYITLKEAAKISDYSADYIGQLIRAGKIEGEQVYSTVAWVTTEASLHKYMLAKNKAAVTADDSGNVVETLEEFSAYILYIIIGTLCVALVILFYIASVSLDQFLNERAVTQTLENTQQEVLVSAYE